jgi:hypothetical protein
MSITKMKMKTNLKGFKKVFWKRNLKGFLNIGNRPLSDSEVRIVVNFGISRGYRCVEDVPDYEAMVVLGMQPTFKLRSLYDNGGVRKGEIYDAEWRDRGQSYKHKENIKVWGKDSYIGEDGKRYGSFAYMDDSILGNEAVYPIFEVVNPEEYEETKSEDHD